MFGRMGPRSEVICGHAPQIADIRHRRYFDAMLLTVSLLSRHSEWRTRLPTRRAFLIDTAFKVEIPAEERCCHLFSPPIIWSETQTVPMHVQ